MASGSSRIWLLERESHCRPPHGRDTEPRPGSPDSQRPLRRRLKRTDLAPIRAFVSCPARGVGACAVDHRHAGSPLACLPSRVSDVQRSRVAAAAAVCVGQAPRLIRVRRGPLRLNRDPTAASVRRPQRRPGPPRPCRARWRIRRGPPCCSRGRSRSTRRCSRTRRAWFCARRLLALGVVAGRSLGSVGA